MALPGGELPGDSSAHGRTPHVTPIAAGMRDYAPGDSLNRIAWAPTARLGRLVVKEFELDPTADIWIVLDMDWAVHHGGAMGGEDERRQADQRPAPSPLAPRSRAVAGSTEEFCVVGAASLAAHFLDQKRAVGLLAVGGHHEVIPDRSRAAPMTKMLEALAAIQGRGQQSVWAKR